MTPEEVTKLSRQLAVHQQIEPGRATELAKRIAAADADIVQAAHEWLVNGKMPDKPVIEGRSPATLDRDYYPSQTFSILIELRNDPDRTRQALRHYLGRSAPPTARG